ncbi:MAG: 1-acyl-sn-glycerol-3-phosphate acyltransferase [Paludibacteraceae bacterium]|nr:1-acyl-sn-glycerol-3-phosphate acyltransferase [Paludibacteraceae bacterium]
MTNKRYIDLQVTPGTYVPQTDTDYPVDDPYVGLYRPVYDRDYPAVDADYPYFDVSPRNRLFVAFGYRVIRPLLGVWLRIKYDLRWQVEGQFRWSRCSWTIRRWLRRQNLQHGAITVANHCYRHDCASVFTALHAGPHTRIPMFAPNFRTRDQFYLRVIGGIPIPDPEEGISAMKAFNTAFDQYDRLGYWIHIFPEAKRWDWYKPLRPFQKGAFTMAYKYRKPILPCAIRFRPRTGWRKWIWGDAEPLTEVVFGEPIYPDTSRPRNEETQRLLNQTHATICRLAGITHNTWPSSL